MFIHLGSRKVMISPSTYHPDGQWVTQQARNATMWLEDEGIDCRELIRDNDTKFTDAFDGLFRQNGTKIVPTPIQAPIANCYAESWIGSFKRECLNHLVCFSLGQFDYITAKYMTYYNRFRPHQSKDNRPLTMSKSAAIPTRVTESPPASGDVGVVRRHKLLGGLLTHYERKAA